MSTTRHLKIAIGMFAVVGLGLIGSIFLGYLGPTAASTEKTRLSRPFTEISAAEILAIGPGDEKRFLVGGYVLGLFRPTEEVWNDLRNLDDHVYSPEIATYFEEIDLFVYWRHTPHCGIVASHTSKGEDKYARNWLGGYHDMAHSSSFDYAGRSIKSHRFALRGNSGSSSNLISPDFEIRKDGAIRIPHTFNPPIGF